MRSSLAQTAKAAAPAPAPLPEPLRRTVLLLAADAQLRELLVLQLRAAGCFPIQAPNMVEARRLVAQVVPDLVVLDVEGLSAAEITWAISLSHPDAERPVPAALLGPTRPPVRPTGGGAAALLCVPKPLEMQSLMRQLLRLLRPAAAPAARARLRAGALEIDSERPVLKLRRADGWAEVDLPWTEHRLLACLLAEAGRACSRNDIRDAVWRDAEVNLRTVDQYVRRLRRTLAEAGAPGLVKTVNGLGYRLDLAALQSGGG